MPTIVDVQLEDRISAWWAQRYEQPQQSWDGWRAPHRVTIPQAVYGIGAQSVYEIGCAAGPNLRLIREECPGVKVGGCDINPLQAAWASRHLGTQITLEKVPVDVDASWDATLACYVLAYCPADVVYQQLERIQSKHLILMEPWGQGECEGTASGGPPQWFHDWRLLCGDTGWQMEWRWPVHQRSDLTSLAVFNRAGRT